MEDRYLFRGKRIDNGEWVQGFLSVHTFIPSEEEFEKSGKVRYWQWWENCYSTVQSARRKNAGRRWKKAKAKLVIDNTPTEDSVWYQCPTCKGDLTTIRGFCCGYCGQKLDWSDEE